MAAGRAARALAREPDGRLVVAIVAHGEREGALGSTRSFAVSLLAPSLQIMIVLRGFVGRATGAPDHHVCKSRQMGQLTESLNRLRSRR